MRHWTIALCILACLPGLGISKTISPSLLPDSLPKEGRYRLVFVTSTTRDGLSSEVDEYNDFVQSVADASDVTGPLGLEWKALVSTETVDARDNIEVNPLIYEITPIYLLDGRSATGRIPETNELATSANLFAFDGRGARPIGLNITENATILPVNPPPFTDIGGAVVHTGTLGNGAASQFDALGGPPNRGRGGDAYLSGDGAYQWVSYDLTAPAHFYAVSEVFSVPEPSLGSATAIIAFGLVLVRRRHR